MMENIVTQFQSKISFTQEGKINKNCYPFIIEALRLDAKDSPFDFTLFNKVNVISSEQKIILLQLIVNEFYDIPDNYLKRSILLLLANLNRELRKNKIGLKYITQYEKEFYDYDDFLEASKNNIKGLLESDIGKHLSALRNFKKVLTFFNNNTKNTDEDIKLKYIIGVNTNIAGIYDIQKKYDKAISIHLKNISIQKENNLKNGLSRSYMNLSVSHYLKTDILDAIKYSQLALDIKMELGDSLQVERINVNLAEFYLVAGDLKNAELIALKSRLAQDVMSKKVGQITLFKIQLKKFELGNKSDSEKDELLKETQDVLTLIEQSKIAQLMLDNYEYIAKAFEYVGKEKEAAEILCKKHDLYVKRENQLKMTTQDQLEESYELKLQQKELEKKELLIHQKDALGNKLKKINEELQQFNAVASHDLKSHLRIILALCNLLKVEELAQEELNEYLTIIKNDAIKLNNLVESLLDYSKIGFQKEENKEISLNKLVDNVITKLKTNESFGNTLIKIKDLPTINGNPFLLKQLFENLIDNALKYNNSSQPEICIAFMKNKTIKISDNGLGIPENRLPEIFKAFTRAHSATIYEGSGVGLATCKKIMEIHHGTISVKSTEGKGSSFYLNFEQT